MKVSKVVMIVVALHVMVIGGIFIFEGCSRAKTPGDMTAATPPDETAATTPAVATDPALAQNMTPTGTPAGSLAPVAPAPVAPVAATPVAKSYTVKKGDTLAKIAKIQGTSQVELAKANHLTKVSILKIGQKLTIPGKAEAVTSQMAVAAPAPVSGAPVDATAPVAAVGGTSYAVKSGDSLWKIAKAHNVSVASIKQANNLSSDSLKINQKITIPAGQTAQPAQAGITPAPYSEWQPGTHTESGQTVHVVDIGENAAAIAKKYNVAVTELLKANNITDSKRIMAGQRLVIPTAPTAAATAPAPTPAVAAPMVSVSN
ncbi:MAG: LysM peptidoglycan-binding domain-containing protein [Verrucomicrobiota bacterium]